MFNRTNTTLVIQGIIYQQWTPAFIEEYKKSFDNIIVSTWEEDSIDTDVEVLKNKKPESVGPGNANLQIKSSLEGIKKVTTDFTIKVRSDILIKEPQKWLDFFSEYYSTNRVFVLGLSNKFIFSARDQLFSGKTSDMLTLFNIPYLPGEYTPSPSINSMYPELWITLHYYAQFSEKVRIFLQNPSIYLYGNASLRQHTIDEWNRISTKYMYPVSRAQKYYWPKRFGENDYNYDETASTYGEFWHDDIQ